MAPKGIPAEVQKLLDEARRNAQPRKHHIVPASYLERWAIDGAVRVHQLDLSESHLSPPSKAARQTDYYRVESADLDASVVPPLVFETILSRVEGTAVRAIDRLAAMPDRIDPQTRYDLATFLGFQYARGHRHRVRIRAMANELLKLQTAEISDAHIRELLAQSGDVLPGDVEQAKEALRQLRSGELRVRLSDSQSIALALSGAQSAAGLLFARPWMVSATTNNLITTDEPVLAIGGPGSPRTESSGIGVAGLVVFPLNPQRMLLAVRKDLAQSLGLPDDLTSVGQMRLDLVGTIEISHELAMSAARWAFERPDRKVVENLPIPPAPEDLSIEEWRSEAGDRSLVRTFNHNRWKNAELVLDWPLARLWPPDWRAFPVPEDVEEEIKAYWRLAHEAAMPRRKHGPRPRRVIRR